MPSQKPHYSIVGPVFNEEGSLKEFYLQIKETMDVLGEPWELILVNDGSRDRSAEIMQQLHQQDPRVKTLDFAKNFGHQLAVTAGIDFTQGKAVIMMDTDLQDPPSVLPDLIAKWQEGYEVVYAIRSQRRGETWFKLVTARLFYRLTARLTEIDIPLDTGDFRLIDRKVVKTLQAMREHRRFIRGLTSWVGFKQIGVEYIREERFAGETHYPFRKMLRLALDAITGFSYVPLQLATYFGFGMAGLSALAAVLVVYARLFMNFQSGQPFSGQATTLVMVLFLGGIQLITLGILGEYIARIYDEVRGRPLYVVSRTRGFEE